MPILLLLLIALVAGLLIALVFDRFAPAKGATAAAADAVETVAESSAQQRVVARGEPIRPSRPASRSQPLSR